MRRAVCEELPAWLGHTFLTMVLLFGLAVPASAQTGTIEGQVVDASSGEPVALVVIRVIGTDFGAETAEDGRYVILNVPTGAQTVQARAIGYTMVTTQVRVTAGQPVTVDFELQRSLIQLDAVVVTGTAGEARRRSVGNTISQINTADLAEPAVSVDNLLQGRSAGVSVMQSSGMAGSGSQIRLRGNVSVSMSNQPLIYVDGVRIRSDGYPKNVPATGYQGRSGNDVSSPLNDIDPADIERMEVIKGAAATTLYGTEASAGVIQIFTKKGRTGDTRWTAQVDQGMHRTLPFGPKDIDWQSVSDDEVICPPDPTGRYGENPCDPSYLFIQPWLRDAWRQKYSLSAAGGGDNMRYYIGGSYERNEGVLPNDLENKVFVRGNFDFSPVENLELSWNTSYTNNAIQNTPAGNNAQGLTLNAFRRDRNYVGTSNPDSIDQVLDFDIDTQIDRLVTGVTARYAPLDYFTNRLTVGYDLALQEGRSERPFGFFARPYGILHNNRWSNATLSFDYLGTLQFDLSDEIHNSFSWGAQAISEKRGSVSGYGEEIPPGEMTLSSAAVTLAFEDRTLMYTGGFFVQNVIGFGDRLFLTLGGRGDYNSVFGQQASGRLQLFPKASMSYVISDESFWPLALGQVKLRAAWGQAGRAPGTFDAVKTWNPIGYGGAMAFDPQNLGNDSLGPERTTEWEAGLEAQFLDARLSVDFSYYYAKTTDALFDVRQAPSNGAWSSQAGNVGSIDNQGIELAVNASVLTNPDMGWDVGLTAYTNKSRVLDLGGAAAFSMGDFGWILPPDTLADGSVEYYSVPEIRSDCIIASESDSTIQYYTSDVTGTIVEGDECTHGPNLPTLTLGFNTTLRLPKGIQLSARGEYATGHFMHDGAAYNALRRAVKWPYCFEAYPLIDAGNAEQVNTWLQAVCIPSNVRSHYFTYPADFFKVRELSLRVPMTWALPANNATLTLSARNAIRWRNDDFPVFDPEMMANEGMNSSVRAILEHVPSPATFTASLRVTF